MLDMLASMVGESSTRRTGFMTIPRVRDQGPSPHYSHWLFKILYTTRVGALAILGSIPPRERKGPALRRASNRVSKPQAADPGSSRAPCPRGPELAA